MKLSRWALCALVVALVCLTGTAFAADFNTLHAVATLDPSMVAMLAGAPVLNPIADSVRREFGRKDRTDADDVDDPEAKTVKKELARIGEQIKKFCDDNRSAIEDAGKLSKEAKTAVDELLTKQGKLLDRLQDVEQKLAKREADPGQADDELTSALRKGIESEEFKQLFLRPSLNTRFDIPVSRKALTNSGVTGTALNYPGGQVLTAPVSPLTRRLTIRDLLSQGRTNKAAIWYLRESGYTDNAAVVSEGSQKPKSDITFEMITEVVRTLAHLQDISLQMLDDVDFIQSYITGRMLYALKLLEETQLLTGSGTGQNIEGIYTAATAYAQPSGAIVGGTAGETDLDKLRLAILQVELAFAAVTGIVLHPTDWANIELLKDTTGQYIFANPQNGTTPRLWGRDVVATPAMTQGRFLVGDFAAHAQIFDRQDANVAISFENKDNFERNMATLRVEERLALAIYRPEAFVKGTLESAS